MNTSKEFLTPPSIVYLQGAFQQVGKQALNLKGSKALIISDAIMNKLGYVDECRKLLKDAEIESAIYLGVASEPTDDFVAEALRIYEEEHCDLVISLGGGSCIDTAKAVSILATNGGYIGDYMSGRKLAEQRPVPHIAIPTTAGTGAEATDVTVITNSTTQVKMMIKQPALMPDAAIVDPMLTLSTPEKVTAATGVDALSHAVEAYISRKAHPMTDMLALSAIRLIAANLQRAYDNPEDVEAKEAMSLAAMQAGMAFSNASVCLVHGMSRPIGALFHVPHGFSNAMLLPAVLEYSKDACVERLADIGRIFSPDEKMTNEEAAERTVQSVKELCHSLNIPNLKEWGIDEQAFMDAREKMANDALDSGSPGNNPKVPTGEEIMELYQIVYNYQAVERVNQ
ncbi:iron-containing alcohol dehydrogenase [Bhargavaea ginsengi]|uniref:iron-containing alcohol dehydrogenase n=1 Tax=Bhargavaea ginsengi TaxID=426757 RepID=UPI002041D220|nr:iron-containing alcohol dehydrogenase [Bhargavaea ginsengi]MCM3087530.1 iron-containing alcohol dehydrogenase [Bhargavaea ginsengi]